MRTIVSPLGGFPSPFGNVSWSPTSLFAGGAAGASWNVLGFSTIGEAIASITDSSGNGVTLSQPITAQQPAYNETVEGIKYAFFDLDDNLPGTLPDLGTDASKWTVTPYAVHVETGQTIGSGSYTAPTNDWGEHGVIDREVTATEINRLVAWAKRNKLTGVDYPTLKTRMDVICMNAVDVAVDIKDEWADPTRLDGATGTPWYAELGARPDAVVWAAEDDRLVGYDATDPALPPWIVFNSRSTDFFLRDDITSVDATDGYLAVGMTNGGLLSVVDFANDLAIQHFDGVAHPRVWSSIADRNVANSYTVDSSYAKIVDRNVNSVAMTVLSGDTEPTIAVATDGGVSVIKDDGTVVDSLSTNVFEKISISSDNYLYGLETTFADDVQTFDYIGDLAEGFFANAFHWEQTPSGVKLSDDVMNNLEVLPGGFCTAAQGVRPALNVISENRSTPTNGMVAHITSTYNTGWMVSDVKGCWLCDTDDADLVGGTDADRSVNNNGLIVNGTITREPVADGAELVAYSGFSATDYLEQPYNSDLDFGTGDFCVMGWVKPYALTFVRCILELSGGLRVVMSNGKLAAYLPSLVTSNLSIAASEFQFFSIRRTGGEVFFGLNGVEDAAIASVGNIAHSGAMTIGYGSNPEFPGSITKLRVSGTAPTAEQIAKIYEDELPLFQEKAAATLAGSGDAVTALAHDPTTGVLRAAQSDTTSLFDGLERVGEEDGKSTCIASVNGIVAGI